MCPEYDSSKNISTAISKKPSQLKQRRNGAPAVPNPRRQDPDVENTSGCTEIYTKPADLHQLTSELLTRFVTVPAEQIDFDIKVNIRRIIESFGFDRCFLSQCSVDESHLICTHFCQLSANGSTSASPEYFLTPWMQRNLLRGECVVFFHAGDLPEDTNVDREYFMRTGTKSHISFPLEIDGKVIGSITLENTGSEYSRSDEVICGLRPLADVFAIAVERRRRKLELMERIRFETLLADLSARFVSLEPDGVDREIELALERIGEFFRGDRCGILVAHPEESRAEATHIWYADGIERNVSGDMNLAPLFPWSYEKLFIHGEVVKVSTLAELPPEADKDRETFTSMGVRSSLTIPLSTGRIICHALAINNMKVARPWPEDYVPRLRLIGEVFINAMSRRQAEHEVRRSYDEIRELKDKLQIEAEFLRSEVKYCRTDERIVGQSKALMTVLTMIEQVAPTDSTVLICGETGTGKELIARAIHNLSPRRDKLMIKVNCASLPSSLVESELFGREKGAYTGALTRQIGRFELADGSTILLDEIAEMSREIQVKLLRVLQEGQFERLGSPKTIQVDVRVIAATNRNLEEEVKKGNFRQDLYYRLNVFPITVPPLRERPDDIPMLVWAFLNEFNEKMGKQIHKIAQQDMDTLKRYSWPGNVRELRNVIEYAVIVSRHDTLHVRMPESARKDILTVMTLNEVEYQHIMDVLNQTGGRIKGEGGAARILGMEPSTLYSRIQKLGIKLHDKKGEISS